MHIKLWAQSSRDRLVNHGFPGGGSASEAGHHRRRRPLRSRVCSASDDGVALALRAEIRLQFPAAERKLLGDGGSAAAVYVSDEPDSI